MNFNESTLRKCGSGAARAGTFCPEPEPKPEPSERFTWSRTGAGAEMLSRAGAGAGAVKNFHGSASLVTTKQHQCQPQNARRTAHQPLVTSLCPEARHPGRPISGRHSPDWAPISRANGAPLETMSPLGPLYDGPLT